MTTINNFDIEFFEIANVLKKTLTEENSNILKKTLLKLNNPTFYRKYVQSHPANIYGYYSAKIINPILIAISNMLAILKSEHSNDIKTKNLQLEYAWAFNNYNWYSSISKL